MVRAQSRDCVSKSYTNKSIATTYSEVKPSKCENELQVHDAKMIQNAACACVCLLRDWAGEGGGGG